MQLGVNTELKKKNYERQIQCLCCGTINCYTSQEVRTEFAIDDYGGHLYRYTYINCSWCLKRITIKGK